jgi:hypothetical protein
MNHKMLDIYTDYLICQNKYATATGLSDLLSGNVSHDKVTQFLHSADMGSKELWSYVKPQVRHHETPEGGVLILDDSIEEKPYTDENEIVCWHHSHTHGKHVKGINVLSCMANYGDISLPLGYEIVRKDVSYTDIATKKVHRTANVSKNEHFRKLIKQSVNNNVLFDYVLADNWFGSKENLKYIHDLNKNFIVGVKSNRTVSVSHEDRVSGKFRQVSSLELEDGKSKQVWLKDVSFPVTLIKKVFKNEDGSRGILYLVSNDIDKDSDHLYQIYQKRWKIEVYHKSIKQNASLAKSPTKRARSQANHIFASIIAFCKLEALACLTSANHFALKYKLVIKANIAAMAELGRLRGELVHA